MRPYKACRDITMPRDTWYGYYAWCGFWLPVADAERNPIRFGAWYHAKHAAKLMHARTRPLPRVVVADVNDGPTLHEVIAKAVAKANKS